MDHIEELARALARFPGIGPRQGKRFVYYLLSSSALERSRLAELILALEKSVLQCPECRRFHNGTTDALCNYCADARRDDALLMLVEKDQDLAAIERAGTYNGRYFVLGGVLTLTGKGAIREKELIKMTERRAKAGLTEIVLALSATSEGEHTADHIRSLLAPYRDHLKISILGRGLATGSELEYSDAETLRAALTNRKET
ncbi:toprim domain-containing protein [Patescibacteria group bacterium]|nr:toprim domain-containing protein [Patescibacteria group bacterium]